MLGGWGELGVVVEFFDLFVVLIFYCVNVFVVEVIVCVIVVGLEGYDLCRYLGLFEIWFFVVLNVLLKIFFLCMNNGLELFLVLSIEWLICYCSLFF